MINAFANALRTVIDALEYAGIDRMLLLAMLFGVLASLGTTQAIKKLFGFGGRPAIALAGIVAFTATLTIAEPPRGWLEFWAALVVAMLAPSLYRGFIAFGRWRGWEWVEALSGDRKAGGNPDGTDRRH